MHFSFVDCDGRRRRDHFDRPADPRDGDLRHLREQGLIETVRLDGRRDVAVVLTERGRDLLESRDRDDDPRREFNAGLKRERELEHDAQIHEAYLSVAERLAERDAHIDRVVLDYELDDSVQPPLIGDRSRLIRTGLEASTVTSGRDPVASLTVPTRGTNGTLSRGDHRRERRS